MDYEQLFKDYPVKLYKYMKWEPFASGGPCYERENLINNELFFSSALSFNDPFDLQPFIDVSCNRNDLIKRAQSLEQQNNGDLSNKMLKKRARKVVGKSGLLNLEVRKERSLLIRDIFNQTGVCCFTTNPPDTTLMWAHYASGHKGICLEFLASTSNNLFFNEPNSPFFPQKVTYQDNRPVFNAIKFTEADLIKCLCTKSSDWGIENEYRAFIQRHVGTQKYDFRYLYAIYAGCKMLDKELDELKSTIKKIKSITPALFRVKPCTDKFAFEFEKISL